VVVKLTISVRDHPIPPLRPLGPRGRLLLKGARGLKGPPKAPLPRGGLVWWFTNRPSRLRDQRDMWARSGEESARRYALDQFSSKCSPQKLPLLDVACPNRQPSTSFKSGRLQRRS
jgi:hypothetical protein